MAQVVQYCRSGHQLNLEIEVRLGTILFGGRVDPRDDGRYTVIEGGTAALGRRVGPDLGTRVTDAALFSPALRGPRPWVPGPRRGAFLSP